MRVGKIREVEDGNKRKGRQPRKKARMSKGRKGEPHGHVGD